MAQTENKHWIDGNQFIMNRNKFTYEQLVPHDVNVVPREGQHSQTSHAPIRLVTPSKGDPCTSI